MDDINESKISFIEHRNQTVDDLKVFIDCAEQIVEKIRQGDVKAFERFIIEGGTEEGDAKIIQMLQLLILRYLSREELLE